MTGSVKGSCLCGSVTFECQNQFEMFHLCHCTQCQKVSGSAHVANLFTKGDNIRWLKGESLVKRYDVPGRTISHAFCECCGSSLPYPSGSGRYLIVPAGCLDDQPSIKPDDHIFWHERASWYDDVHEAKKYDGFPS